MDGVRRHHTKRGPPVRMAPDSKLLVCQAHGAPIGEPQMVLSHSASLTCLKLLVASDRRPRTSSCCSRRGRRRRRGRSSGSSGGISSFMSIGPEASINDLTLARLKSSVFDVAEDVEQGVETDPRTHRARLHVLRLQRLDAGGGEVGVELLDDRQVGSGRRDRGVEEHALGVVTQRGDVATQGRFRGCSSRAGRRRAADRRGAPGCPLDHRSAWQLPRHQRPGRRG